MTNEYSRQVILDRIRRSIETHGHHVRVVAGGPSPRFAYTIGLYANLKFELIFSGGAYFSTDSITNIINEAARHVQMESPKDLSFKVSKSGKFAFREVESTWTRQLLLGALDFFNVQDMNAFQIVPDKKHWTIDIPNMRERLDTIVEPAWKWLQDDDWKFPASPDSIAITNLDALRGYPITEVVRWEEKEWEMFSGAGPEVKKSDIRLVPLGIMIGHDPTLECVTSLNIGSGLRRKNASGAWHPWEKK